MYVTFAKGIYIYTLFPLFCSPLIAEAILSTIKTLCFLGLVKFSNPCGKNRDKCLISVLGCVFHFNTCYYRQNLKTKLKMS